MEQTVELSVRARRRVEETIRALLLTHRPDLVYKTAVDLLFHRNRRTMISWSRRDSRGTLRLHHIFGRACPEVLEAIVRLFFTTPSRREKRALRCRIMDFVAEHRHLTLDLDGLPKVRPPKGRVYDLDRIREQVADGYLADHEIRPQPRMGWSRRKTPTLMGKWIESPRGLPNLIVINRLLDNDQVPQFYLEYIVFHEMLHDLFPIRRRSGRWVHHPAEFRRRERSFPHYEEARRWEEEHLPRVR